MAILFALLVLEPIPMLALLDGVGRDEGEFPGGAEARRGWILWLTVAVATGWFLVGNGIVLGYYDSIVRQNTARY